jgi:UDP-glucuronate 4-epimerase
MNILVTGAAGFIGSHVAEALLARGETVAGLDNFSDHYDPARKRANVALLASNPRFTLHEADVRNTEGSSTSSSI